MIFKELCLNTTDIGLVFQYVSHRINVTPYRSKKIHTYSGEEIQGLLNQEEKISFVRPAEYRNQC